MTTPCYRRALAIMALAAAAMLVVGAGVGAAATTWTVDDDGGADFTKIQDAVDAASDGDTIRVGAGTYVENVNVTKSLILRGLCMPIIESYVVSIMSDNCTLDGFTFNVSAILVESNCNTYVIG